jgi:hypothetical protein
MAGGDGGLNGFQRGGGALAGAENENFSQTELDLIHDASPFPGRSVQPGPGRPRGSQNKRTIEMRELYLKSGFPHPQLWMGHCLKEGPHALASSLGCTPFEAWQELRKIAADLQPYMESKMPTAIVGNLDKTAVLVMGEIDQVLEARRPDGAMAIDDADLRGALQHFQEVSGAPAARSDGEGSDGKA